MTTALAWLSVVAACTAAVLLAQTARTAPPGRARRATRNDRIGLAVSRTGPWLAVLLGVAAGAVTGEWLIAAVGAFCGVVVTAVVGLLLAPH